MMAFITTVQVARNAQHASYVHGIDEPGLPHDIIVTSLGLGISTVVCNIPPCGR